MKFIHIADMHFDGPFVNLTDKENLGDLKRLEQRKVLKKVIEYIKENNIENLFISGDLYENKYIKESTIIYINNLFKEIPNTQIYIAPGNHDPYIKKSYYNTFKWNENVKIFKEEIEKIETKEADIYGYGFNNFYCTNSGINNLKISNREKTNILIIHGDLDATNTQEKQYNSMPKKMLAEKGFNYIALGHIHKTNYLKEENIVYPGSPISLGFDEIGKHGMVYGEIKNGKLETKYIELEEIKFGEIEVDITPIISKEEIIEKLNSIEIKNNELIKITLIGKRSFEIDIYSLYKLIENERIIKIKDKTKIKYNLEKVANENTLKGLFIKEMMEKINSQNNAQEKEIIEKAIEMGLEVLK